MKALLPRSDHTLLIQARVSKYQPDEIHYSVICLNGPSDYYKDKVDKAEVDDYGTITKLLEVRTLSLDLPQWEGLKAADVAIEALEQHKQKLRADFAKTMAEVQARINTYLALPNEADQSREDERKAEARNEAHDILHPDDDIPF